MKSVLLIFLAFCVVVVVFVLIFVFCFCFCFFLYVCFCLPPVFCAPNVASVSGLSIIDCTIDFFSTYN